MREARGLLLVGLLMVLGLRAEAGGKYWPGVRGPMDGTRVVDTGDRPKRVPLGGYAADLVLWDHISQPAGDLCTGDLDGDGDAELVTRSRVGRRERCRICALDNDFRKLWERERSRSSIPLVCDLDGDGKAEVIAGVYGHGKREDAPPKYASLEVWNGDGTLRWKWVCEDMTERERNDPGEVLITPFLADDLDNDGKMELLVLFESMGPRRQLWLMHEGERGPCVRTDVGPAPTSIAVADINRDGKKEIFAACYSQGNGIEAQGVADDICRVLAFDSRLNYLWIGEPLGGTFVGCDVAIGPRRLFGPPQLGVFVRFAENVRAAGGLVEIVDSRTGKTKRQDRLAGGVSGGVLGDVSGAPKPEVVCLDSGGDLRTYDLDLALLDSDSGFDSRGTLQFGADLDGDGKVEIVSTFASGAAGLTDLSFFPRDTLMSPRSGRGDIFGPRCIPWDVDNDGVFEVAATVKGKTGSFFGIEIYKAAPAGPLVVGKEHDAPGELSGLSSFEWSPDGRRLLALRASGDGVLYRWHKGLRERIADLSDVRAAAFSPDGDHLAAIVGGKIARRRIAARSVDGPTLAVETALRGKKPRVPGRAWGGSLSVAEGAELVVFDARGGREEVLAGGDFDANLAWADGATILVSRLNGDTMDILAYPRQGGEPRPLAGASDPAVDEASPLVVDKGSSVVFTRWDDMQVPYAGGILTGRLFCVPVGGGKAVCLNTDEALYRALRDRRYGVPEEFLETLALETESRFSTFRQVSGSRESPFVVGRMIAVNAMLRDYETSDVLSMPRDIWLANPRTQELHIVTFDDECSETEPALSPDGDLIAYVSKPAASDAPTQSVVVTNLTGVSSVDIGEGGCPRWSPTEPGLLWFLRGGTLRSVQLRNKRPPRVPLARSSLVLLGALLGFAATASVVAFRLPARLAVLIGAWILASRMARQTGHALLVADIIRRLDGLHAGLHSLKNTIMVMPAYDADGVEDPRAMVEYVFDAENVGVARKMAEGVLRSIADIESHLRVDRSVLRELPPEIAAELRDCTDLLVASRPLIAGYLAAFDRDSEAFGGGQELPPSACARALDNLRAFYEVLIDERERTGLMDRLRDALSMMQVKTLVTSAAAASSARASSLNASVEASATISPMLYVCGNPGPIRQILVDTIANSLDAIAEQRDKVDGGLLGRVEIAATETEDAERPQVVITILDNGAGLAPELAERLNRGAAESTRGRARGSGFIGARRALDRYPGGEIRIAGDGPGKGAVVRITLDKV